ncbi:MAG: hypothetical protein OSA88_08895 [Acidimicrobiales bacterium]|mgnify:FL=1|nr:hypothetical protein [Acidimicrobiales bacterium]
MTSPAFEKSADTSLANRATKIVVDFVELLRGRTTGPLLIVARVIVYGIVLCVTAVAIATLVVIAAVKATNNFLPGGIWSTHLLLGALFTAAGGLLWSKRLA